MPRTKRPVRKQEKHIENDDELKLMKLATDLEEKIDTQTEMNLRNIEMSFKILLQSIRSEDLQKTVGQLKAELELSEPINSTRRNTRSSRASSRDDGYLTENSGQGSGDLGAKKAKKTKQFVTPAPSSGRNTSRRSRSVETSARRGPSARPAPSRARSVYRTPMTKGGHTYPAVTPKVAPNTPLPLLRQPRQGEMAVSMLTGSPLSMPGYSSIRPDDEANCVITLADGTVLTVQPQQLRESIAFIPPSLINDNLVQKMKILQENLNKIMKVTQSKK